MNLDKSTSTSASLKKLQEEGALPGRGTMEREPGANGGRGGSEEQPDKIPSWTAKPALTLSLQSFIDIIDDLRVRGLLEYEVAADFIGRRIQLLQARAHPAFDYSGPEDTTRVSPQGLNSATVERRVAQVMISGPTTVSNAPIPLCEKEAAEREAAINALPMTDIIGPLADHQTAASLKEGIAQEASDAAIAATAATTSGGKSENVALISYSVYLGLGCVSPASTTAEAGDTRREGGAGEGGARWVWGNSSVSPAVASTDVVVVPRSREVTPSGPASDLAPGRGPPAAVLTWGELQVEMGRILEAGARGISCEIAEARAAAAASANERADKLARDLAEVREDLQKMRELVAGNERQWQGLENCMSELENNPSEIRGLLRVTYTGLHQLARECSVKITIPANPDEFSLTSSLAELAAAMEVIPSKHAAGIGEETSNGIYTGACHVLACVRLAHPELDLQKILDQGAASDARNDVMEEVGDLGESVLPLFEEDVDVEDIQQRGQPELPVIAPVLALEPYAPQDDVDQDMAMTPLDLESALADHDRRVQYWRTKFGVAELERTMLEVKRDRGMETLRGREVWFNSYLRSFCTAMVVVCRELRIPRGDPKESAAGYISWLNGACAQLEGIGKRINEALKQECRRSSRYAGGHVLACIRDHRPQLHLEFLHEGFSRSRRTPAEIDNLAKSMAPLAEKIF
uniref:Myosin heavy chain-like protein n=1 Tax=Oryza sativa subsp. japonica TaxID=39947 RepID=Q6Z7M4_ORYSJ|nr:myosin heavy chain-like protein [Oryza sativa Japonica Group]